MNEKAKSPIGLIVVSFLFMNMALAPAMAHLLELPSKMRLGHDEYFIVQQVYRNWAWSGIFVAGALFSTLLLAISTRHSRPHLSARAIFAFLCLILTQIIFWNVIYPVNAATQNWMIQVTDWEVSRVQWEYSYALNAAIVFVAQYILFDAALNHEKLDNVVDQSIFDRYNPAA